MKVECISQFYPVFVAQFNLCWIIGGAFQGLVLILMELHEYSWQDKNQNEKRISSFTSKKYLPKKYYIRCKVADGVINLLLFALVLIGLDKKLNDEMLKALTVVGVFAFLVLVVCEIFFLHKLKLSDFYAYMEKKSEKNAIP